MSWDCGSLSRREPPVKTAGLEFELCGQLVRLRAALDTGCHLQDPLTCLPVLVVSYPDARARLPAAADAFLAQWFAGQDHAEPPPGTRLRLVPCGTAAEKDCCPALQCRASALSPRRACWGWGAARWYLRRAASAAPTMRRFTAVISCKGENKTCAKELYRLWLWLAAPQQLHYINGADTLPPPPAARAGA